jgi:hypothetical protein
VAGPVRVPTDPVARLVTSARSYRAWLVAYRAAAVEMHDADVAWACDVQYGRVTTSPGPLTPHVVRRRATAIRRLSETRLALERAVAALQEAAELVPPEPELERSWGARP